MPADSEAERAALAAINTFRASGSGYFLEQATRPQIIGYALLDSPVALAGWMLDHDTDSEALPSRHLLPRSRQGWPLRRLGMGRARTVHHRDPGGVQVAALTTARTWA